ncbi:MAG: hypothetical protein HZB10_00110 [Candidatus Yonathbacteria bacterium]|nr:hypothetical protein [Candidatus Yonathbacteria bacterium]
MSEIVVARDDKRSFLEKVIAHGIDQGYLTPERRQGLARECAALCMSFCQKIGMNASDMAEALEAARIVTSLLGLALERESEGNVSLASIALARPAGEMVISMLTLITQTEQRVESLWRQVVGRYDAKRFDYFVHVWRVESVKELDLVKYRDALPFLHYLKTRLKTIQTARDLTVWLDRVADVDKEFQVSQKFLPWPQLIEEANLRSTAALPTVGLKNFYMHPRNDAQMKWSPNTLLASMTVTLVCGGTHRRVGTIVSKDAWALYKRSMKNPDYIRQRSRLRFEDYLDYVRSHNPDLDADARVKLMKMWERAMDALFLVPPTGSRRHFNLLSWSERLHMENVSGNTLEKIVLTGQARQRKSARVKSVDKIRALGPEPLHIRLVAIVRNIKWTRVSDEEFVELLSLVPPAIFTRYTPVISSLVTLLVKHWDDSDPAIKWVTEDKRNFIQRILDESYPSFWETCSTETLEALMQAVPDEAPRLKREMIRYNRPEEV